MQWNGKRGFDRCWCHFIIGKWWDNPSDGGSLRSCLTPFCWNRDPTQIDHWRSLDHLVVYRLHLLSPTQEGHAWQYEGFSRPNYDWNPGSDWNPEWWSQCKENKEKQLGCIGVSLSHDVSQIIVTLPKTNTSHLKVGHPKRKLVTSIPAIHFQVQAVSFREGTVVGVPTRVVSCDAKHCQGAFCFSFLTCRKLVLKLRFSHALWFCLIMCNHVWLWLIMCN